MSFEWGGVPVEARVTFSPGASGRTWGPPDLCYQDESDELDVLELFYDGEPALDLLDSLAGTDLYRALLAKADAAYRLHAVDLL